MGEQRIKNRPNDPLAEDIRWFFSESESALGIRSSFGAIRDLALSGIPNGGRTNGVELRTAALLDRDGWPTERHRRIRERLRRLAERDGRLVDVLWVAFGPFDWSRHADQAFGKGTGDKLAKALGPACIGVALLTEALARVHEASLGPPREVTDGLNRWVLAAMRGGEPFYRYAGPLATSRGVPRCEPTPAPSPPGAVLVALATAAYPAQEPRSRKQKDRTASLREQLAGIRREAEQLLTTALAELRAVGPAPTPSPAPQPPPRMPRHPRVARLRSRPRQVFPLPPPGGFG